MDFYSFYTGQEFEAYKYLGAHQESSGWVFRTFAPQALGIDLLIHGKEIPMERIYDGNFFEATVPDAAEGDVYEYRIYDKGKRAVCHMDPYGYGVELRPDHKSVVRNLLHHEFRDKKWMKSRSNMLDKPLNIYEIHAGSWKKPGEKPDDWYSYTELVNLLIPYLKENYYNYVEFMPLCEYPTDQSWGYQNNVEEYLSVPRTVFVVPVYQRNYDWKEENCKQLFYDIEKSIDTGREHFLGTICFKNTSAHERSIIDGQQRLISITLLLKAIYDYTNDDDIKDEIRNTYIYNKGHSVDSDYLRIKLHLNKRDDVTYHLLLENSYDTVVDKLSNTQRDSRVYQNYALFTGLITDYVEKKNGNLEDILEALRNLTIIELEIQQENPQEIFESLNSTGLDLTNVDLLRNYFLMQFSHQEQTHLYDEYWSQIEDSIGVSNMEQFFNDYLIYKKRSDAISINGKRQHITQRTLYTAFKDYYLSQGYESNYTGTESCFADLKRCAFLYKSLVFDSDVNLGKESYLRQRLYFIIYANEAIKSRCILLYLLDLHDKKLIDDEVLLKSVEAVLSLTFRAKMCKAKGINYQFAGNVLQRLGEIEDYSDFMNAFWKVLTFGKGSFAFPSNEEFREALTEKDLYLTIRSKGVKYLLYALEEKSPFPKGLPEYTDETITIEHVMPQTLTEKWKGYLSTSDLESYEVYLHRLGNLALTNYNSEMSNKSFDEKKGIYKGSKFYYTTKLSDVPKWSSAVISKRGGELADAALKVWELPKAYQETRATHDSVHTLDEDPKQYAYTKPKVLYVGENEFNVSSWSNILPIICGVMVDEDTKTFLEIAKPEVDKYFSLEDDEQSFADKPSYEHIINNVYIYTHNSAHGTLTVASRLLKMFDEKAGTELYDNTLFTIK